MYSIIIHGGCNELQPDEEVKNVSKTKITEFGNMAMKMLSENMRALDVAEKVINMLEDDDIFDAGTGSFANLKNEVEMDALIMTDKMEIGGVLCIKDVKNPISVARMVMEKTPHILLCSGGATDFARHMGFTYYNPVTKSNKEENESIKEKKRMLSDLTYYKEVRSKDGFYSTVGVAVLDSKGDMVAATSTGGIRNKMPGRVGDSALPGAGTFCDENVACSATGEGEKIIKLGLTRSVALSYQSGKSITDSCKEIVQKGSEIDCVCGVIALTKKGEFSYAHNGVFMPVFIGKEV